MNATDHTDAEFTFKVQSPSRDITAACPEDGCVTLQFDPGTVSATSLPWEESEPAPRRERPTDKAKAQAKKRRKQAKASRRRNR